MKARQRDLTPVLVDRLSQQSISGPRDAARGRLLYPRKRTSELAFSTSAFATSGLMHCSKRRCYSIISAERIADRPSSLDIGSHSFSCLKLAFLIPIQGRPSQSFVLRSRCGRINYQSGGPAPSSIFRQLIIREVVRRLFCVFFGMNDDLICGPLTTGAFDDQRNKNSRAALLYGSLSRCISDRNKRPCRF